MGKVHLITGYAGEEHIHSADQGSFNASFFGGGEYVMEAGNQLEASIMDNNTVRILDGDLLMQGRHIRIDVDTYEDITITTGTAGVNRNDLIVMQYSKDTSTDIESAELVVVKGTEAEGTASDPGYTSGDILAGATFNQMPLYRVKVEGVVLSAVEPLFTTIPTYKKLAEQYAKQFQEACDTYLGALNILDTKEEIEANTKANQLAGALALKEVIASLGDVATVKVSDDKAWIQLWNGEEWVNWKSTGFIDFNVLNTLISDWNKIISYMNPPLFELSNSLLRVGSRDSGNTYGTGEVIYRTDLKDFSKYNVLHLTGIYFYNMWNIGVYGTGEINLVDINGNKTNLYSKTFTGQIREKYEELPGTIDISDCIGEYYLEFYIKDDSSNQRFEITNMVFSAD